MKEKYARLIRIGILSRCYPYKTNREPDPVFGGYFTMLDITRLREFQSNWESHRHIPLVQVAHDRTEIFTITRYV